MGITCWTAGARDIRGGAKAPFRADSHCPGGHQTSEQITFPENTGGTWLALEETGQFSLGPKKGGPGPDAGPEPTVMGHKKGKSGRKGSQKSFASRRTINPSSSGNSQPSSVTTGSFQEHDAQGRQGSFETAGEHARTGNRGHQ